MKHPPPRLPALFFSLVLSLGLMPAALAQSPPQAQQFTLVNGMTLIVKPDRRAPTAVHMVWLRVGAMDEVDGTTGVVRSAFQP